MISAQILSIVAFFMAWVWWVSFTIGSIALVLLQIIWCCRPTRAGIIAAHIVCVVASLACIFAGIFLLIARKDSFWCVPFTLYSDDDFGYSFDYEDDYYVNRTDYRTDYCPEKIYAIISFVDAALYLAAAHFTIMFVRTGRYAKWEALYITSNDDDDDNNNDGEAVATATASAVEMGNVDTTTARSAVSEEPVKTVDDDDAEDIPAATLTTVADTADSYVPPNITNEA